MSQPFVGQVIMFGGSFAPSGWAKCQGQTIDISQNSTLFNLIGTTYGGNGTTTFNLPDLQGRVPIHQGMGTGLSTYVIGQKAGSETISLTAAQTPIHSHLLNTLSGIDGNVAAPASNTVLADEGGGDSGVNAFTYTTGGAATQQAMKAGSIGAQGSSQPHNNVQPVLAVTFCIALFGIYPSQN